MTETQNQAMIELTGMVERHSLPEGWGDGWASGNARDLVRIGLMCGFGAELPRRVALAGTPGQKVNTRTVERIMAELAREDDARCRGVVTSELRGDVREYRCAMERKHSGSCCP